jgi:hypothetical protein
MAEHWRDVAQMLGDWGLEALSQGAQDGALPSCSRPSHCDFRARWDHL